MNILLYAVPAAAAVALLFAFIKARGIARHDEGEPGMAEIARAISEGADLRANTSCCSYSLR